MPTSKEVIFVRHGECQSNLEQTFQKRGQVNSDPLTERGKEQARRTARFLSAFAIDTIVSSSYLRTRQTAEIINEEVQTTHVVPLLHGRRVEDVPHDHVERMVAHPSLLREIDNPTEIGGMKWDDPKAKAIQRKIARIHSVDLRRATLRLHYSDEENMYDLWRRAQRVVNYLEDKPEQRIVVVAHGGIMKLTLANMFRRHKDADHSLISRIKQPLETRSELQWYEDFTRMTQWGNAEYVAVRYVEGEGWQWPISHNNHLNGERPYIPNLRPPEGKSRRMSGRGDTTGDYLSQ